MASWALALHPYAELCLVCPALQHSHAALSCLAASCCPNGLCLEKLLGRACMFWPLPVCRSWCQSSTASLGSRCYMVSFV